MEIVKVTSLRKRDWITDNGVNFRKKEGKFAIARVEVFKIIFDKVVRIDMDEKSLGGDNKDWGSAINLKNLEEKIIKLDKKDLKDFKVIETKFKIINKLKK